MLKLLKKLKPFALGVVSVFVLVIGTTYSDLHLPDLMSQIVNVGIVNGDMQYIILTGFKMVGFALFGIVCTVMTGYLSAKIGAGFGRNLRADVFRKIEGFSLAEFDVFGTASLITRTTNDITQIQNFITMMLRMMLMAPIMCLGGIFMAYQKSPQLSRILLFSMPALIILVTIVAKKALPLTKIMQKKIDRVNLVLREKLTGVRVIRAFNTEEHERQRFKEANFDLTSITMKMQRTMGLMMPTIMLILNATTVFAVWFGGIEVNVGSIMVGDLMAFIQYVMQIMMSLTMLSMIFVMIPRASTSAERINQILETKPIINDKENAVKETEQRGYLEFRDVTFKYANAEMPALENISFSTKPGETTAIIGSTGSGKSTLINLIPRFYDVESGAVLVDGIDVRDYDQKALRSKIGYVPQKAVLFKGTIEDNIRHGNKLADTEQIEQSAKTAQASDFILAKDEKFNSPIAQGGTNVSGGQKQRLSIARAIVRKPEIYIFDDSFSALDFKTDLSLRNALKKETENSTVIIVAQRISTIISADRIIVLDEGRMVGMGTHKELLKSCAVYKEIVSSQLSEEEIA